MERVDGSLKSSRSLGSGERLSPKKIELFEQFFSSYEQLGYSSSLEERERLGLDDSSMTFGQIQIDALAEILQLALLKEQPPSGQVESLSGSLLEEPQGIDARLLDMGSGLGKAVMGAVYLYPQLRATGVELLPALHQLAQEIALEFEAQLAPGSLERTEWVCGDMFDQPLAPFSLILVNSTCMGPPLLQRTSQHLEQHAQPGTTIISLGRALRQLPLVQAGAWRMGWQSAGYKSPVFIYRIRKGV